MSKYIVKYNESIIDISVKLYGSVNYVFDLINWNPLLIDINNGSIVGLELYYEPILISSFKSIEILNPAPKKNVTIKDFQSIFDLSLQIFGSVENVFDVVKLANIESINETENTGIIFKYDYLAFKTPKYLSEKNINISTKYPLNPQNYRILEDYDIRITEDGHFRILE